MGKKMKLPWPICGSSKTPSFRADGDEEIFKTVNSDHFFDNLLSDRIQCQTPDSWFARSSPFDSARFSTEFDDDFEVVVRGAKSERLIFVEPGETRSILGKSSTEDRGHYRESSRRFEGSVALAMESEDPYLDFRSSMEEMVESHGIRDWECLQALLSWYLRVNRTKNHGYILGAFVDLLVDFCSGGDGGDGGSTDSTSIFSDELIIETSSSSIKS